MPNPLNAGQAGDGSKSLAKESKAGIAVQFAVTVGATGLLAWLDNLDTSHWSGWWLQPPWPASALSAGC